MVSKEVKADRLRKQLAKLEQSPADIKAGTEKRFLKFFADHKMNVTVVNRNLKVSLPTSKGLKEYEGIKLSNGKTYVYTKGNQVLQNTWA